MATATAAIVVFCVKITVGPRGRNLSLDARQRIIHNTSLIVDGKAGSALIRLYLTDCVRCAPDHAVGIDLLDISYRMEREFGVGPTAEQWRALAMQHQPPDIRVGDLYVHVGNLCRSKWLPVPDDSWPRFQKILSHVTGIDSDKIQTDSWLIRDLGVD